MSHTTVGFTGQVDHIAAAKKAAATEVRFATSSAAAWRVDNTAGDRTVRIKAGVNNTLCGLLDGTNEDETLTFDPNTAATGGPVRYDLGIVRAIWAQDDTGVSSVAFDKIKGTPGEGPPPASVLTRVPGVRYEAVLTVVRVDPGVGTFPSSAVADVAPSGGRGGPLVVPDGTHLQYLDADTGQLAYVTGSGIVVQKNADGTWGSLYFKPNWPAGFSGDMKAARDASGFVHLAGTITYNGDLTGSNIPDPFELPPEYRPTVDYPRVPGNDQLIVGSTEVLGSVLKNGRCRFGMTANNVNPNVKPRTAYYSLSWPTA